MQLTSIDDLAALIRGIENNLRKEAAAPLPDRVRSAREAMVRVFDLLRFMKLLPKREDALQLLVSADTRLDDLSESPDEVQLRWVCLDIAAAADLVEGQR